MQVTCGEGGGRGGGRQRLRPPLRVSPPFPRPSFPFPLAAPCAGAFALVACPGQFSDGIDGSSSVVCLHICALHLHSVDAGRWTRGGQLESRVGDERLDSPQVSRRVRRLSLGMGEDEKTKQRGGAQRGGAEQRQPTDRCKPKATRSPLLLCPCNARPPPASLTHLARLPVSSWLRSFFVLSHPIPHSPHLPSPRRRVPSVVAHHSVLSRLYATLPATPVTPPSLGPNPSPSASSCVLAPCPPPCWCSLP